MDSQLYRCIFNFHLWSRVSHLLTNLLILCYISSKLHSYFLYENDPNYILGVTRCCALVHCCTSLHFSSSNQISLMFTIFYVRFTIESMKLNQLPAFLLRTTCGILTINHYLAVLVEMASKFCLKGTLLLCSHLWGNGRSDHSSHYLIQALILLLSA